MPLFQYHSTTAAGTYSRGTIAADSGREAREKLRAQGLVIENLSEAVESVNARNQLFARPGRYTALVATMVRDLATLLSTGIGLVEALDTLSQQYKGAFQLSLISLRQQVASGTSLSEAMVATPSIYDELTVQMVKVGENSGTLDIVLDRLADFRERYLQFKDRVVTALMYPAIVVGLAVLVSVFLMTVVLPNLLEGLLDTGKPLPWPTQVLKWMSDMATQHGFWLAAGGLVTIISMVAIVRTPWGKRKWHQLLFRLPILGPLAKKQEIARAAVIVSTLMKNGIPFVESAGIAARASRNVLLKESLETMCLNVQSGRDIGEALEETRIFPPMVVQIFTVGQQTGKLEEMLDRLANGYERQVASATDRLTAAIEPILIVCLSIFVGFILFATILPILEAGNVL